MAKFRAHPRTFAVVAGLFLSTQAFADPLVISEFRVRGPNSANDELEFAGLHAVPENHF
ncbi:MAG: hypothetical protein ACSLE2_17345 [Lysobacterales bacterium]